MIAHPVLAAGLLCFFFFVSTALKAQDVENLSNEKAVSLSGAITLSGTDYQASGIPYRREPFSWMASGSPTLTLYGIQMPFYFIFSEQERNFRQPFDQFGVSPTYKSFTGHFGYRSMTFSHYGLAGVTFLGAGVEATPSIFRLGAMYGRLQRAVEEDTSTLTVEPAYKRMGFAAKVGLGTERDHVDLTYFHAKDDSNSITRPIRLAQIYPQENAVFGLTGQFSIIDELSFSFDGAVSALTRDLRADSLVSKDIPSFVSSFLDVKSSSSVAAAAEAAFVFRLEHFATRLAYQRIEPDYTSLGAYYFNTDIENITIAPSFDIFEGKVRVNGSVGLQHDNVLGNKLAQTSRIIGSAGLNWSPSKSFGFDGQYMNYSTDQGKGMRPINDSVRVRNVSQSASLAPRYIITDDETNQIYSFVSSLQQYSDLNAFTNKFSDSKSATAALSYTRVMPKTNRSIGGSLLFAITQTAQITTRIFGGSLNGSITFDENKFTLAGSAGYTRGVISTLSESSGTFTQNASATYQASPLDNFSLVVYGSESTSSQFQPAAYQEVTATLSYTRSFSF
jgi:hypothetical protein